MNINESIETIDIIEVNIGLCKQKLFELVLKQTIQNDKDAVASYINSNTE